MDIFFKDNLNSSDQLYIEQLLCASMAASTDNTGSWGITPALTDILDADGWWFAASDPDLISKSCPVSKTYLSGCMAVYQTGDDSFECVPFVHPDLRKKGIFSSILAAACEEDQIPGEGSVYFSCGTENKLWKNVLEHIGAEHAWDEYMMERELTGFETMANEKTADMLGVKVGDTVELKKGDTIVKVKISVIVENYVRHYLYLTTETYESLFHETPNYNQLLLRYQDTSKDYEDALGEKIMKYDSVAAISFTSDLIGQIDDMLRSLDIVIVVLIVSAGLLAFVVLYNLNNINITERQRELATLKVLGFYDGEVASYVYRENIVLTLFGIIAGMGIGNFLHHYVIQTVEVDMMMFGRNVFFRSYFYSGLITLAFALFVNGMMFYRLRKIDMIESLKSVE